MGNSGDPTLIPQLEAWTQDPDPVLAETAIWALAQLSTNAQMPPAPNTSTVV
jgi:hypothetical protein